MPAPLMAPMVRDPAALACAAGLGFHGGMSEAASEPRAESASPGFVVAVAIAGCVVGGALRLWASQTDPWLDEVWTFRLLPRMLAASDVLFELHHANNHPLNTLFLYWLGDGGADFWWYRLHTMAAGLGTIVLAVVIAARRGAAEAAFAAVLFATSFIAIHHASQARGYALMLFGALGAFYALQRHHEKPSAASALAYGAAIAWALLSNLYALTVLIGLSLWSAARAVEHYGGLRAAVWPLVRLHALPALVFAGIAWVFYLPGLTGTQFTTNHYGILVQAFSLVLGGPFTGRIAEALLWVGLFAFGLGMIALRRDRDREWLAYALVIAVAPALVILVSQPRALFVRFFAAGEMFLLLLIAIVFGGWFRRGWPGKLAALALAAAMIYGNLQHVDRLISAGRGRYLAASRYMAHESFGSEVWIASDHAFGTAMMLQFYDRFVPEASLRFIELEDPARAPEWFVRVGHPRPPELQFAGNLYARDRAFPGGGFGLDWQLYRRVPLADAIREKGLR